MRCGIAEWDTLQYSEAQLKQEAGQFNIAYDIWEFLPKHLSNFKTTQAGLRHCEINKMSRRIWLVEATDL